MRSWYDGYFSIHTVCGPFYLYDDTLFNVKGKSMIHGALTAHAQYAVWFIVYRSGSSADKRRGNMALKDKLHNT